MKTKYIHSTILLIIVFLTRHLFLQYFPHLWLSHADSVDYFLQSIDLNILPEFTQNGIDHNYWLFKTPAYLLWLKVFHQSLYSQILLSMIATWLMFRMNKFAGWFYALWPPFIYYDIMFFKEGVLLDLIVIAIYLLRNKHWKWTLLTICLIMFPFQSFGIVAYSTASRRIPFMNNWWALWYPGFNVPMAHWPEWGYILTPFYMAAMFYFLKVSKPKSFEWSMWIVWSLVFGVIYGNARYRGPFMIVLFLWIGRKLERTIK